MKISEAFDQYKSVMNIKGFSKRVIEHHDYVKSKIVEYTGDRDISQLSLDDVFKWEESMKTRKLPNGDICNRCQNTLRCDMQRLKGVIKYMNLIGEK